MLIAITVVLVLIPASVILWPFIRRGAHQEYLDDESSPRAEIERRWNATISGLKSTELDWSIGNLEEEDYRWLRDQYINDAAVLMKAMELEEVQEQELLETIESELRQVRSRILGSNGVTPLVTCHNCSYGMEEKMDDCPNCGAPIVEIENEEEASASGQITGNATINK